jgi:dTDP-4-amino-4,6-dideoxygalactose transaminase
MTSPLALFGGTPAITVPAPHFTWPPLTSDTADAVLAQLQAGISIYDRSGVIAELEDALCGYHRARHAVLTSSGTAALHSVYAACGIGPGDEVIVPAYTFYATATPLLHLGAIPVLADCDDTGNLDPADVKERITARTVAVMVTHMWGLPADMDTLREITAAHDLLLLEDASHAAGASITGRKTGTFGDAAAFSLNGPKPLSAGEGGFVLTDDDEIYYRVLLHGHYNKRCRNEIPASHDLYPYAVTGMGLKFRIHPLAAAIALGQLAHLDTYLHGRDLIANRMREALRGLPGITVIDVPDGVRSSWYGMILRYQPEGLGGLPIERLCDALKAEGCNELDRPGSTCPLNLHLLFQAPNALFPHCAQMPAYAAGQFPRAEAFHANTLKLPVWHREADLPLADAYTDAFAKVTAHHRDLTG